ncbi:hypothetical protein M9H77_26069 [Catharanthus roseus]|uniref:Uncharacterized protein n=1 Tax=Catharanthus roseus TaxID=4058 RepID=A0ACC0A9M3_CATRO|nr:hypothetical protein M9H77_26069 [Catharanthus roseus]
MSLFKHNKALALATLFSYVDTTRLGHRIFVYVPAECKNYDRSWYEIILSITPRNMDFNINGDFEKILSCNIDMPDLDISSPLKKDAKPRTNRIKSWPLELEKEKKIALPFHLILIKKENSSNRIKSQNSGDHPADKSDGNGRHEDAISKMATPEALITETLHTQVDVSVGPAIENLPSESVMPQPISIWGDLKSAIVMKVEVGV